MILTGKNKEYLKADVAVIGAGHAGCEAALACARLGLDTVLFTISLDSVANMPCNPSIGGTGKGHLVYEIDALGGEMGRQADIATIQSRMLNTGKGAAVQSKRVQADRQMYRLLMKHVIEKQENLRLVQAEITDLCIEADSESGKKRVCGVLTQLGEQWRVKAAVICTGTYLGGKIFVGEVNYQSGPDGTTPANELTKSLHDAGIRLMRFKTGTPQRVLKSSIDLSKLEEQEGESDIIPFSVLTDESRFDNFKSTSCHVVYTNEKTHKIIRDNLHKSALYGGKIQGTGPRYCPSIEDKIVRFADKERHQLFVEPMGENNDEMYIQGFSTSMPPEVQYEMLRSLEGFENAQIMRYAYAIEYDCCDPTQLFSTLEFKEISGLYGAGQFNGTSGYEEAAAQGLVAGVNAALKIKGEAPLELGRSTSYIGTLIDDLVTKGTNEPYRIMTSRSEYRLLLRQDNADLRLSGEGHRIGLVTGERYERFINKKKQIEAELSRCESTIVAPAKANPVLMKYESAPVKTGVKLADLIRRPELDYERLAPADENRPLLSRAVTTTVQVQLKYDGYIKKQEAEVQRQKKLEEKRLSEDIDYTKIGGLRIEAAQKLNKIRPKSIGQASRISGVNPADISVLLIWLGVKPEENKG